MTSPITISLSLDPNSNTDFRPTPLLSQSAAEAELREEEMSIRTPKELGVSQYDAVRVPSNFLVEDELIHVALIILGREEQSEKTVIYWGVFDGHEQVSNIGGDCWTTL